MEYMIGGLSGMGGTVVSNPMDVVKIRLQLQGELKSRWRTVTRYRGVFHALYVIAKMEGPLALQKGLVPALYLGFGMNGLRLGLFQVANREGYMHNSKGGISLPRSALIAGFSGMFGTMFTNPFYLIKTRAQSSSHPFIAVGRQHHYKGMVHAIREIYKAEGISGFWVGSIAAGCRLFVGSSAQLTTFSKSRELLKKNEYLAESNILMAFIASCFSGMAVAGLSCPLDVCTVRLYNQGANRLYGGMLDCLRKIALVEGLHGLYKGLGPLYLRVAPHNMVCLLMWDTLNRMIFEYKKR